MNTIDHLGKFAGKSDEGFLVGYSLQSKAFRVYNLETKRVEENLHINFLENKPNIAGKGPTWLFDLDYLTDSMNYHPVRSENQANHLAEDESAQDCFVLPIWPSYSSTITPDLKTDEKRDGPREEEQVFMDELERLKRQEKEANEEAESLRKKFETLVIQEGAARPSIHNNFISTASSHEGLSLSDPTNPEEDDSEIPPLEDIYQHSTEGIFTTSSYDDEGVQRRNNHKDFQHCLFACFLSQHEPKRISEALEDESWVDAMQEEMLQFEIQKVWVLVDLPYGKKAIDPKYPQKVYKVVKALYGYIKLLEPGPLQESSHLCDVKRIFRDSDYAEQILDRKSTTELSNFLTRRLILAMQKANHCGYFYYRGRICCCCKLQWASFVDSKSNVRLWVQLHKHKDLH
ncbi:putative ribonuclease H-like domain-containing protein [Tanacetum coccineum]